MTNNISSLESFIDVDPESPFPIQNIPFGVFKRKSDGKPTIGTAIGDMVVDLAILEAEGLFDGPILSRTGVFQEDTLNSLMSLGRPAAREARETIIQLLAHDNPILRDDMSLRNRSFVPMDDVKMMLPVRVGEYTDFYSSEDHASNIGRMFRGEANPLMPNWKHLPVGYDSRGSSVVVSGTDVKRPMGQIKPNDDESPIYGESQKLGTEIEIAFFIGKGNKQGEQITVEEAPEHIFGMVILSDWSARDIQKWEYVPLGPFLGKNFITTISPWVITMDALEQFRVKAPQQDPEPLPYLQSSRDWNFDIHLEMLLKTENMSEPERIAAMNFREMYWDCCQQLAHHTVNGCNMQTGDLVASGTISNSTPDSLGSIIELSWNGTRPFKLANGEERKFLLDGDEVTMRGFCQGNGFRVGFGHLMGQIVPSLNQDFTSSAETKKGTPSPDQDSERTPRL